MKEDIKVSVAVITYGQENYIRKALDSILMQEVDFKYEIIVGEDCSPDNTRVILLEYKDKYPDIFTLILRDERIGGVKNYYDVSKRCKSPYIATLEGDDFWTDTRKLQKQVDFLENNSNYIGCSHNYEVVDRDENHMSYWKRKKQLDRVYSMSSFLNNESFPHVATLVYRNIFLDNDDNLEILYKAHKYIGDVALYSVLLDKACIYVMSHTMSAYRLRILKKETNWVSYQHYNKVQCCKSLIEMYDRLNEYFENRYDFSKVLGMSICTNIFEYIIHGKIWTKKAFANLIRLIVEFISKEKFISLAYLPYIAAVRIITYPERKLRRILTGARIYD